MNDLKLTLYDFFAFLLPGLVAVAALVILFWSICAPQAVLTVFVPGSFGGWVCVGISYIVGHMLHPLANRLRLLFPSGEKSVKVRLVAKKYSQGDELMQAAQARVAQMLGLACGPASVDVVLEVAVATARREASADYDVFQYREGFYRGLTVAFSLLFVSLIVRMIFPGGMLSLDGRIVYLTVKPLILTALLTLFGTILSLDRYRRFSRYRVWHAFMLLLTSESFSNRQKHATSQ